MDILNNLARGDPLNRKERNLLYNHPCDVQGAVQLYETNAEVDKKNDSEFRKLNARQVDYRCLDDFQWKPHHPEFRDFGTRSRDGTMAAPGKHQYRPFLQLKVGMPVILTTNLDVVKKLVNGSQGTIVGFQAFNEASLPRVTTGDDDDDEVRTTM